MAITKSKPSYKTINRFRVNPKVDALLESLFIQFYSQCVKQNLIDDKAILLMVKISKCQSIYICMEKSIQTMNQR